MQHKAVKTGIAYRKMNRNAMILAKGMELPLSGTGTAGSGVETKITEDG